METFPLTSLGFESHPYFAFTHVELRVEFCPPYIFMEKLFAKSSAVLEVPEFLSLFFNH